MAWASPSPGMPASFNTLHRHALFGGARIKSADDLATAGNHSYRSGMPSAAPVLHHVTLPPPAIAGLLSYSGKNTSATGSDSTPAGAERLADQALLLEAVLCRLRAAKDDAGMSSAMLGELAADSARAMSTLLGQLAQSRIEGDRMQARLQTELQAAHRDLSEARHELVGTRAGERRARHMAQHDELTTLPNSGFFRDRLDQALSPDAPRAPALAVLYLDLDGFKPINDQHGHDTGDELLRIVAQRLRRSVRAEDMVCRLGGDEFACLLSDPMGRDQLSQLASKLFDTIAAPLQVGALELSVRPSIGIAVCPADGNTAASLLKRADTAMYRAKRRQLGFAFFDRRTDL